MKIILIFTSILMGALGQVCLKNAALKTEEGGNLLTYYLHLLQTPFSWLGALCYGLSFAIWMRLLKTYDLSYIRPLVSLGYVLTAFLAMILFKERIGPLRWAGITLIVAGVYLVSITAKN